LRVSAAVDMSTVTHFWHYSLCKPQNKLLFPLHFGLVFKNYAVFGEGYEVTFLMGKASTLSVSFVCLCDVAVGSHFGVLPWKRG
jgi:hypothetical protein